MHTGSQEVQPMAPVPVQESPSQLIHNRLLNLRDTLDSLSVTTTEKLSLVMRNVPPPCEKITDEITDGLPPLFVQYDNVDI